MATRRGFMWAALGAIGAFVARPFTRVSAQEGGEQAAAAAESVDAYTGATQVPTVTIPLDEADDLRKVGGSAAVKVEDRAVLIVRDSEETVRAFSHACTHARVKVKYDHKNQRLNCPAHGSRFDLEGAVLRGPAKEHLETYRAELTEDSVMLYLEDPGHTAEGETQTKPKEEVPAKTD